MRKKLTTMFACLALSATMLAQAPQVQGAQGARGHAHAAGRVFEGLNLTADQKTRLQSLLQEQRSQMQALRNNTSLTAEQKKQQSRELRKTNHEQLLAILTPEQQAQLKQMHQQRAGRRASFNDGRRFQALNLTAEQKSQLKPIFESTRQEMKALRGDTSLTPEQKREKMQQIRQNQMTQLKSILTPEQQQQLQQGRGRRMHKGGGQQQTPPST